MKIGIIGAGQIGGRLRHERRERRRFARDVLQDDGLKRLAGERQIAAHHRVRHDAERIEIAAAIEFTRTARLLR